MVAMAAEASGRGAGGGGGGGIPCLGNRQSIESELVRRNREIAQVRDLLRQRELEIEDWKGRHSDLVGRYADVDGELTKTRARHRQSGASLAAPSAPLEAVANRGHDSQKCAEPKASSSSRSSSKLSEVEVKLRRELQEERARVAAAVDAAEGAKRVAQEAIDEAAEARRERNRAAEAAAQRAAELELESSNWMAKAEAARSEAGALRAELAAPRTQAPADSAMADKRAAELAEAAAVAAEAVRAELMGEVEAARAQAAEAAAMVHHRAAESQACRLAADRAEELEERLATERRSSAANMVALEEQLTCERRARRDADARHVAAAQELKEAMEGLAATAAQLEAAEAAGLARSLESRNLEQRLRGEVTEALEHASKLSERAASLEEELRASSHFESRARALQTECGGLRAEVGALQRQAQQSRESHAMEADELRLRQLEAAAENNRLRLQLEETRRARSLELRALVTKMCDGNTRETQ